MGELNLQKCYHYFILINTSLQDIIILYDYRGIKLSTMLTSQFEMESS